jgi:ubiquinone biosynthesis protein
VVLLKPRHLKRYKDVAWLLVRHGRADLARFHEAPSAAETPQVRGEAKDLAADLEKLGPTFIKLGQLLSTRADLLPLPYLDALSRLQNDIAPFPFQQVEETVASDLGVRLSRAFATFDEKPLACASLGQVHRATLRNGRLVAVKVQRPGIRERITEDFEALGEIAGFLDGHTELGRRVRLAGVLEEFRRTLMRELDYQEEAANLRTLSQNVAEFDRLVVPAPVDDFTAARVLTMDFIQGRKVTALDALEPFELDGEALGEQLIGAYLKQILVDGFLHADPHPGNIMLTPDGRLALLDLGMVVRIIPKVREALVRLILAIGEGRGEDAAEAALDLATTGEDADKPSFQRRIFEAVAKHRDLQIERMELGRVLLETVHTSVDCGVRFAPEISMVGQTLLKLDRVGRILAPRFRPNESIRRQALRALRQGMGEGLSLSKLFQGVVEARDFVGRFPGRVNRILDSAAEGRLQVKVHAFDEIRLMEGFQKVANRITTGLILAALIVGAALFMRVETPFRILGYPGLAMLCFLGAALGGVWLVVRILLRDERMRPPPPRR